MRLCHGNPLFSFPDAKVILVFGGGNVVGDSERLVNFDGCFRLIKAIITTTARRYAR